MSRSETEYRIDQIRVDELDEIQPLGRYLILLFRAFEEEILENLHQAGYSNISPADLEILRFIKPEGSNAVEIAKLAGITKQAVGKTVQSLEKRKYLKRTLDPDDKRALKVVFTQQGEALILQTIRMITSIEQRYSEILGQSFLQQTKQGLKKLFLDHKNRRPL